MGSNNNLGQLSWAIYRYPYNGKKYLQHLFQRFKLLRNVVQPDIFLKLLRVSYISYQNLQNIMPCLICGNN